MPLFDRAGVRKIERTSQSFGEVTVSYEFDASGERTILIAEWGDEFIGDRYISSPKRLTQKELDAAVKVLLFDAKTILAEVISKLPE